VMAPPNEASVTHCPWFAYPALAKREVRHGDASDVPNLP
jgi:hypothetical protein